MALRNTRRLRWRRIVFALAILTGLAGLAAPASAQFFGERFGWSQRPSRPAPPPRNTFSFPFFSNPPAGGGQYGPFMRPPQAVESTKAPPPRKYETPPASTVVVIGDSMADWLAYGLEERLADSSEIGVERKIRPTSGLIHYEPRNDTLEWPQAVKDMLATEKPSAIVVMLGLNDRVPLRDKVPVHPAAPHAAEAPAAAPAGGQGSAVAPPAPDATAAAPPPPQSDKPPTASEAQHPVPGATYDFHTDKWADLYAKRIDDMIAVLKSKGVPVLWVGLPAIRGPRSTSDMSYLDEIFRERAERAGIVYVNIWDGFVDENGRYVVMGPDFEGQNRRLRTADGVHFTKAGAVKLASYVEQQLRRVISNHLAPVALPAPEAMAPAKPGGPRPTVGPVLPLTASDSADTGDLLGAGNRPPSASTDPVAAQVLSRGDPLTAPSGRADDFSWPRPQADANAAADAVPVAPPTLATPPKAPAGRDSKNKSKTPPDATAARRSPQAGLDGGATTPR